MEKLIRNNLSGHTTNTTRENAKNKEVCKMADLKCKADTCTYNKNEYCCKGDIMVGGRHAVNSDETCCESFAQKRGEAMTNATSHPSHTISIDCEVAKCVYNANYKCTAEHVDISGSGADSSRETSCSTFREK